MAAHSAIEWTDATWNVVSGCTKVSDGCTHCYIDRTPPFRMQHRKFDGTHTGATTGVKLHSERLHLPLKWRKPQRIFVCSLADLFQDEVPDAFIAEVFAVMSLVTRHTFQVLTKRHARMRSLLNSGQFWIEVNAARLARRASVLPGGGPVLLPNVWIGVSVEDQKWADIRIPALLETPATVRWISAEPLLGPLDLTRVAPGLRYVDRGFTALRGDPALGWVVLGGESGPGARPMLRQWASDVRRQCESAGVPFLFKQWGAWAPSPSANEVSVVDTEGHEWTARMFRGPKTATGRVLDGQTWDQYPEGTS